MRRIVIILLAMVLTPQPQTQPAHAQTSTIFGIVTAPDGVTPVVGAEIQLLAPGSRTPVAFDETIIDGTFVFATTTLAPGPYTITALPPEGTQWGASEPFKFELADNITDVDVGVLRLSLAQVTGVLVSPSGRNRLSADSVNLRSLDGSLSIWDFTTPERQFSFGDLSPGEYIVEAFIPSYTYLLPPSPVRVTLGPDQPSHNLILRVRAPDVIGVVGLDGQPVSDATVSVYTSDGSSVQAGTSDSAGRFVIDGLVAGATYIVEVNAPDPSLRQVSLPNFTLERREQLQDIGTVQVHRFQPLLHTTLSR